MVRIAPCVCAQCRTLNFLATLIRQVLLYYPAMELSRTNHTFTLPKMPISGDRVGNSFIDTHAKVGVDMRRRYSQSPLRKLQLVHGGLP